MVPPSIVRRAVRHHRARAFQQVRDLHHGQAVAHPLADLVVPGLQRLPAQAVPARPDRADRLSDLSRAAGRGGGRVLMERHPLPALRRQAVIFGRAVRDQAERSAVRDLAAAALAGQVRVGT
jgi:hypothetical protein